MTREEAIKWLKKLNTKPYSNFPYKPMKEALDMAIKSLEQEPTYKSFAEWVAGEIFSEYWEYSEGAFEEIACRKLAKLGIVTKTNDEWVYEEKIDQGGADAKNKNV